jgi:hypothetical protein
MKLVRPLLTALVGAPLLAAVVVMATRLGDTARFVAWPVVAFTALAAGVTLLGVWTGLPRPIQFAAGVLPALLLSYFLPAAPLPFVAAALLGLGALAFVASGAASGAAATTGALMALFVVLQGPAVECGTGSVSSGSGPWWLPAASSSSGSGSVDGTTATGSTQVGRHHYVYTCTDGRLTTFERREGPVPALPTVRKVASIPPPSLDTAEEDRDGEEP